jgi:O-antigen/teichoic acid export membrane protein
VAAFKEINATEAVLVTAVAGIIAVCLGVMYLRRYVYLYRLAKDVRYRSREWIAVGFSALMVSAFALVIQQTDILMLGVIKGVTYSGLYSPAAKIALIVIFGINIGHMLFAPVIASKYASDEIQDMQGIVARALKYILIYTFLASAVIVLFGEVILGIYGDAFLVSYPALLVLVLSYAVSALTGLGGFFLTLTNCHWQATRLSGICALLNVMLNMILIPPLGLLGAALATALTTVMLSIMIALSVWRYMGIDPTVIALFSKKYYRL